MEKVTPHQAIQIVFKCTAMQTYTQADMLTHIFAGMSSGFDWRLCLRCWTLFNAFILDISADKKLVASVWHTQKLSADRKKEKYDLEGLRDTQPPAAHLVSWIFLKYTLPPWPTQHFTDKKHHQKTEKPQPCVLANTNHSIEFHQFHATTALFPLELHHFGDWRGRFQHIGHIGQWSDCKCAEITFESLCISSYCAAITLYSITKNHWSQTVSADFIEVLNGCVASG